MKEFIKKIAVKFEVSDFRNIKTKEGFIQVLTNFDCPQYWIDQIDDSNWETYREIIYDACI